MQSHALPPICDSFCATPSVAVQCHSPNGATRMAVPFGNSQQCAQRTACVPDRACWLGGSRGCSGLVGAPHRRRRGTGVELDRSAVADRATRCAGWFRGGIHLNDGAAEALVVDVNVSVGDFRDQCKQRAHSNRTCNRVPAKSGRMHPGFIPPSSSGLWHRTWLFWHRAVHGAGRARSRAALARLILLGPHSACKAQ